LHPNHADAPSPIANLDGGLDAHRLVEELAGYDLA
jgi:hypothetical protein